MPVSGNEEPGVKPIARQSSDSVAGIPIKKRRFILDLPASPPSQAESPQSVEKDLLKKEPPNPSQDSSATDASVATSSSGLSITKENTCVEERRGSQSISNIPRVKIEELSHTISSGPLVGIERKVNQMLAEKPADQIDLGNTELKLATKEALALNTGNGILGKLKAEGNCRSESSTSVGNTELSLGLGQVLGGENIQKLHLMQEKMDHISLNLSLSKVESSTQCQSENVGSNISCADLSANRFKWDLNTTMDVWEGSAKDAAAREGSTGVARLAGTTCDTKPLISLAGKVSAGVVLGNQKVEGSEHRSSNAISSILPSQQYKSDDSLILRLSPSYLESCFSQGQSSSSATVNTGWVFRNISMPGVVAPACKSNVDGHSIVKSEPFDESINQDLRGAKENSKGILVSRTLKSELVERSVLLKVVNSSTSTLIGPRTIKSELVGEGDQGTAKAIGVTSHLLDKRLELSITEPKTHTSGIPSCSKVSAGSGDVSNCSDHSTYLQKGSGEVPPDFCERVGQSASEMVTTYVGHEVNKSNVSHGMIDTENTVNVSIDDSSELCGLNLLDKPFIDKRGNDEGSVSDEEKINISADMLEEDSYNSDYDSDGNRDVDVAMDREHGGEDDDYEDGEVREPLVLAETEGLMCEKREENDICSGDTDDKKTDISGLTGDEITSYVEEKDCKTEDPGKAINDHSREPVAEVPDNKIDQGTDKDASFQESMTIESLTVGPDKQPVKTAQRKLLDRSGRNDAPQGWETEQPSDQATDASQVAPVTLNQGAEGSIKGTNLEEKKDSALPKAEISLNGNDAAKNASSGGNRSRIINLKASNVSSSCKTRSIPEAPLPSRTGRNRFSDSVLEGDKVYHPRGREEVYNEGPHKFPRERNRDQPFRTSRMNYSRGRGRGSSRLNTICGDWNSDPDFPPEFYNDSTGFRFPRQKHGSAIVDTELECDDYSVGPDDRAAGSGRGWRKPLNDEGPTYRHFPSRRRSPGRREGPASRGVQMIHRVPKNFSPSRCIGEDGSELVGPRHNEKFMRGLPDDIVDPMLTRSQRSFEALDGHFVRGSRNFASIQGRGLPRIRSKSPIRSGAHSPGPWSSPRGRSPNAFNGNPRLTHRRSAAIYRTDRMRSPDRSCFPEEIVARRHGSPPYLPRVSDDMDSGREHSRSVVCDRSPSGRVVPRNNRRFDILETGEGSDTDEYFGSPMRPSRFHELGGEVSGDERRRCSERRGPGRHFRPPCIDDEGGNFHFNVEDGSRPYRFGPETDSEFSARGNLREREFDRQIKNRPGHAPRRMRGIEDQEVNFRLGRQGWHDDGFDDIRLKRRRF